MPEKHFFSTVISKAALLSFITTSLSFGAVIYDVTGFTIPSTAPTQTGRLPRSGVPTSWATSSFPGVINTTVNYRYAAYLVPISPFPYLQISFYDEAGSGSTFASAYLNAFEPTSTGPNYGLDTNYLGDAGSSSNFGNPPAFQVKLSNASTDRLLIVVNDTSATGAGVGVKFDLLVEGFYDTNFNDTNATPEPTAISLAATGLVATGLVAFLRRKKAA